MAATVVAATEAERFCPPSAPDSHPRRHQPAFFARVVDRTGFSAFFGASLTVSFAARLPPPLIGNSISRWPAAAFFGFLPLAFSDAFAVIRETIRSLNKVAIGRVVLTNREHIIALEPLDNGLMGTLLRYPYEVRSEKEYFDDIQDVKITKDMLDLAKHIVEQKSGSFEPDQFEDRYESALIDLINKKRAGVSTTAKSAPKSSGNVINLMDALKRSLASEKQSAPPAAKAKGKKPRKAAAGQREMLLPISGSGKRAAKETVKEAPKKAAKPVRAAGRVKKAS